MMNLWSSIEFATREWATVGLLLITILCSCTTQPLTVVELAEGMRFARRTDSTLLSFPSYLVEVRHTDSVGITQLRQVMGDGPQGLQGLPLRSVAHFGNEGAR